jgi:hypothetical protein
MTFHEQARQVRDQADTEAIAQVLAQYPWGKDVWPRPAGSVQDSSDDLDRISSDKHTMELQEAHISYDLSVLEILDRDLGKLDTSIPSGFEQVDVVLTALEAYQV